MALYPNSVIMVFCKAPVPGQVKTRLAPPLSNKEAAQLHCELTELTLQTATQQPLCDVQLWCSPSTGHPFFSALAQRFPIELKQQQGLSLGERMHQAFSQALSHYQNALVIGCDCPSLTRDDLELALFCLARDKACVVASAEDGGYVLIGLNQPQAPLFEAMPWGSDQVMAMTRAKLIKLGLPHKELAMQWDVDTISDLERYRQKINQQN